MIFFEFFVYPGTHFVFPIKILTDVVIDFRKCTCRFIFNLTYLNCSPEFGHRRSHGRWKQVPLGNEWGCHGNREISGGYQKIRSGCCQARKSAEGEVGVVNWGMFSSTDSMNEGASPKLLIFHDQCSYDQWLQHKMPYKHLYLLTPCNHISLCLQVEWLIIFLSLKIYCLNFITCFMSFLQHIKF